MKKIVLIASLFVFVVFSQQETQQENFVFSDIVLVNEKPRPQPPRREVDYYDLKEGPNGPDEFEEVRTPPKVRK